MRQRTACRCGLRTLPGQSIGARGFSCPAGVQSSHRRFPGILLQIPGDHRWEARKYHLLTKTRTLLLCCAAHARRPPAHCGRACQLPKWCHHLRLGGACPLTLPCASVTLPILCACGRPIWRVRHPHTHAPASVLTRVTGVACKALTVQSTALQVGPPSPALKGKPVDQWGAREVADTVLQDR